MGGDHPTKDLALMVTSFDKIVKTIENCHNTFTISAF
jgi:hypothetical protein